MPRLTIVIPALGNEDSFETTILSVLENRPADCEILVPQCGDYPDPYSLSDEVIFIEQPAAACGAELINTALERSSGEFIHLLSAGATVTDGWTAAPLAHFYDPLLGSVSPLLLEADGAHASLGLAYGAGGSRRLVGCGKKYQADRVPKANIVGPSVMAGFYRKQALDEIGGWPTTVGDELADCDLAMSLQALGWTTLLEPHAKVLFDTNTLVAEHSFRQAWHAERMFWRHAPTVGWLKSIAMHGFTVGCESIASLPKLSTLTQPLARSLAMFELPRHLRFHGELREAAMGGSSTSSETADEAAILPLKRTPSASSQRPSQSLRKAS